MRDVENQIHKGDWLTNTEKSLAYYDMEASVMKNNQYFVELVDNEPTKNPLNEWKYHLHPLSRPDVVNTIIEKKK